MDKKTIAALGIIGVVASGAVFGAVGYNSGVPTADEIKAIEDKAIASVDVKSAEAKAFAEGVASVPSVDVEGIKSVAFSAGVASVKIDSTSAEELAVLEQALIDNNGDLTVCTEELDDDEASLVGDCAVFMTDVKNLALAEAKAEIADLVDGEVVAGETLDEDDVERIRLNDDLDEVAVTDLDFEDKDAKVEVSGTFEHDDVKYEFEVEVEFKDGEVSDVELISVELA